MKPFVSRSLVVACLLAAPAVRGHGTIPTDNSLSFGPGTGGVLLGTNFGGILRAPDGDLAFICETAVTGFQQTVDVWLWLPSGQVLAAQTGAGFVRGVVESDPSACGYTTVVGTEDYLIADLVADPAHDTGFFAVGADDTVDMLMRGADGAATVIYTAEPDAVSRGVRAAAGHAYAVFTVSGQATLVHFDGAITTIVHPLAVGETLRPLGVSATTPTTAWFVRSADVGDTLLITEDAGATLTPVHTIDARIGGFAIAGDDVWVQSARWGIERSRDGGHSFTRIAGSPLGTCLGIDAQGRLNACAVPWVDGFVLGVSDDGETFTALVPAYDATVEIDCPAVPETTTTCREELDFLRGYYGFTTEPGVEPGPESVEAAEVTEVIAEVVEAGVEAGPEIVEGDAEPDVAEVAEPTPDASRPSDGGCSGGLIPGASLAGVALLLARRVRERRV